MVNAILVAMFAPLIALSTISLPASATKLDSGDNKKIYLELKSGKQINALEAFKAAMADEPVLECQPVEAVGNQRTGKVTLKKVK